MSLDLGGTALDLPGLPAPAPQQPAGPVLPSPAQPPALDLGAQAPQPALPPAPKPKLLARNPLDPTQFRKFGDSAAIRKAIYDRALEAARNIQPVKNNRYELSLTNVDYADPDRYSLKEQKAALMGGTSIARRLRGTWQLKDANGDLVEEKHVTLAKVPHFTDRGTFINNGTEYSLSHQLRLRPGVYTRQKANGEIEAHANVVKGPGHTLYMDPSTGVFKMGLQQANLPLITVMKALGATDSQLKEAWGEDLYNRNSRKDDPHVIEKLYKKLVPKPLPDVPKSEQLRKVFDTMQIDPDVSKRTLGAPHANMTQEAMMDITKKLIRVSRQEEEPDDRDAMPYQTIHGPEDVIAERIGRARKKMFGLLWKTSGTGKLGGQFHNALDDEVRGALLSTKLGQALEEINLMEVYDQQSRVTRMGDGGISSMDAVPIESRSVHPSQLGFIDSTRTAESSGVGVDLRLASNVIKGPGNKLYTIVKDKDGDEVYKDAMELADSIVAMPGELNTNKKYVSAIRDGKLVNAHRDKVDYEIPDMDNTFSPMANMVPGKSAVKGQRLVMASRMLQQALPLRDAESPFVQGSNRNDPTRGYDEQYGSYAGAVRANQPGQVLKVHEDGIDVQYQDGTKDTIELANNFPFNRKVALHQTANVKPGDTFDKDHLLATSNFTDKQGAVALGKNLRVAYLPYDGKNWEDAIVISESAAKKFSSEHMYKNEHEYEPTDKRTKAEFLGMFATKFDKTTLAKLDDNGVIKPGTVVNSGDPLILVASQRERNKKSMVRGKQELYSDKSIVWDSEYPGEVTDVLRTDKGAMVTVKAYKPAQVADKLSGRFGDKGVIGGIVPDDQMPHGEDGQPYEIMVSPLGLSSRINPSQLVESALGKIAERTGQRFKISDFNGDSLEKFANEQLRKNNIPDKETLIDPRNGSKIKDVATGNRWFMKLHHMADDKIQGRGLGSYSSEEAPAGKSEQGDSSKKIGLLDVHALLSHGATKVLRSANLLRGQANPDYWAQFMAGNTPSAPEVPFVYEKFVNMLKASGMNPIRNGQKMQLMAMTDKMVDEMAGDREIKNADTLDWKTMDGKPGGLFDQTLTGGHKSQTGGGNRWSFIRLHTPMLNPIFEEPARRLLNLTKPKFEQIMKGEIPLGSQTGPKAIATALGAINLDKMLAQTREAVKSTKKTARDDAIRKLGYLKTLKDQDLHPKDWIVSKVPVLPPAFRPISVMGAKKLPLVADANYLYADLFNSNKAVKDLSEHLDEGDMGNEMWTLYNSHKAVVGLGEPVQVKNAERGVTGLLKQVLGSGGPKTSMIQRKLLGSHVDFVGRGVIIPNPDLDMDQVGLPEDQAWSMYAPMLVRRMVRQGMPRTLAMKAVEDRVPLAQKALEHEMKDAVVVYNRAPTLHRYNFMAGRPVITKNKAIELSPYVVTGHAADFDGDQMNVHALVGNDEKQDALAKMLPSKNLLSTSAFQAHQLPTKDYVAGLYAASTSHEKDLPVMTFQTEEDAIRAYRSGKIGVGRRVKVLEH